MRQRILGGSKTRVYSSFGWIARPIGARRRLQLETLEDRKLLTAAGLLYIDPLYGYQKTSDVQFGTGSTSNGPMSLLMDVYQPTDIGLAPVQTNRPAVVVQDGGAWTSGDKGNGRVVTPAIFMAQHGYTVFVANYRQVNDSPSTADPGPWSSLSPSSNSSLLGFYTTVYPGVNVVRVAVEDFATAITYVRNNAATYGIDPNHIAGVGGSAGAIDLLDLEYNGNTTAASYRTQANISAVGSMMGDWNKVVAGGAPLLLWNNAQDPLIYYNSDVEPNLHHQLQAKNIYYEQWMETPNATDHNVHYDQYPLYDTNDPYMAGVPNDQSELILDRMRDFLAYHFTATGPITIFTNDPPTIDLGNHPNYAGTWSFAPVSIEDPANAAVTDDGNSLSSMTVSLTSHAGDVLAADTTGTSISQSWNGTNLVLSGDDSAAHYQQVLRTIQYNNTAGGPGVAAETATFTATDTDGTPLTSAAAVTTIAITANSSVSNRFLFYNGSTRYDGVGGPREPLPFSDDNAIATDKSAYLPGSGATTFANVSSYTAGINGLMIDITGTHGTISPSDFTFKTGNNNTPSSWTTVAATPTVTTRLAGSLGLAPGGPDRIEITFPDNAIQNTWLEMIVKGNDTLGGNDLVTGLAASNVTFWGSAVADDGNTPDDATTFRTDANDELDARNNPKTLLANIPITNIYDYNRDGTVGATDQIASRNNANTNLTAPKMINISGAGPFAPDAAPPAAPLAAPTASVTAAPMASTRADTALASGITSLLGSLPPSLPLWPNGRLQNILDSPRVVTILDTLEQRDSPGSRQILQTIDQFADKYNLHDDVLDGILVDLALE